MRLLLDTHTLLWLVDGDLRRSKTAKTALMDATDELFVSVASIWELAIKTTKASRPLILNEPLDGYLSKWLPVYQLALLTIEQSHARELLRLPDYHRDPFDRMRIAQSRSERMGLVSADPHFTAYPITLVR